MFQNKEPCDLWLQVQHSVLPILLRGTEFHLRNREEGSFLLSAVKDLGLWSFVMSEIPFEIVFSKFCVLHDNAARKGA